MKLNFGNSIKYIAGRSILACGLLLFGCSSKESTSSDEAILNVSVKEPVHYDYDKIKESGVLRIITRYSSNTYFLHQGVEWGFEYELAKRFARNNGLALEVVIIGPHENPYDLLNRGKGDIITANYTATPARKKYVDFTRPHNIVNQVIIFSGNIINPPKSIDELVRRRIPITVRQNSSYYQRLRELRNDSINIPIHLVPNEKDTESLLFDVSRNKYQATVADDNIFRASNKYMDNLVEGPVLAKNDTIAWAIRKNAPELKKKLNDYLYRHFRAGKAGEKPKRSTFLNILRKRYFVKGPQIAEYYHPQSKLLGSGVISPYDKTIKQVADSAGLNWLMVASIIAQETKFNPNSQSWAGAMGLMQVLPRYSEVADSTQLFNVEINLHEGIRIIKEHLHHYSYLDSTNRWSFALAAYNVGQGHIADARRLAIDHNKNPNKWKNTADALIKLMQRKYYKDARYGFCRGIETVRYVREIKNRYKTYKTIVALSEWEKDVAGPGVLGLF